MKNIKFLASLIALCALTFQSCVKTEFDEPPGTPLSELVANTTIAELKASIVDEYQDITEDLILEGVVISNDKAGNIYKELYIQDETGGAIIGIDQTNLNVLYTVGRTIFIKLNGLSIFDNDGLLAIGASVADNGSFLQANRIPEILVAEYIEKGAFGDAPTPRVINLSDINDALLGTLVQFEAVQFTNAYAGGTYADAESDPPVTVNTFIEDCNGAQIILRNSGFSNFANEITPTGNGTLTALLSKFNGDYQLFIRDTNDVDFEGPRCGDTVSDLEANTSIADLWAMHTTGEFEAITADMIIEGTVTSSDQTGNFFKVLYLEDATGAVRLIIDKFDLFQDYAYGRKVFVKLNGLTLGDDFGILTIGSGVEDNNGTDRLARIGEGQVGQFLEAGEAGDLTPTTLSITDIGDNHLNKLIRLDDVQFTDADAGQSFADAANQFALNRTLEDCENTIILRSSGFADFADTNTPNGRGSVVAILSKFQETYQLVISFVNNLDMTGDRCDGTSGGGGGGTDPVDAEILEGFDGTTQYEVLDLEGWFNIAELGSDEERWIGNEFSGNKYGDASAYNSIDAKNINWLITPGIDLSETKILSFLANQHHWASNNNGQLSIWISNDFDGDVEDAEWEEIDCTLPTGDNDWYEWVNSGAISLNDYFSSGTVHVGFRYEGSNGDEVTGFQLDDVTVAAQ